MPQRSRSGVYYLTSNMTSELKKLPRSGMSGRFWPKLTSILFRWGRISEWPNRKAAEVNSVSTAALHELS